jgi:putative NADH-flavin reductase
MKLAVVGATGHTGRHVVEQGLARGDHVTALARRADSLGLGHKNLVTVETDVLDREGVAAATVGCEAVISALGIGTSRARTVVYSNGVSNILSAMGVNGITKLAVISAAPVGPRDQQPFLERRLMMPILERIFGATYQDMRRMEAQLRASDVDWVALRPPRLIDKPATGHYRIQAEPLPKARSITYADLASALLDALDRNDLYRHTVSVAN